MTPPTEPAPPIPKVGFWKRVQYLFGPIVIAAAIVGGVYLFAGLRTMNEVLGAGGLSLFGLGTTVIFAKAVVGELGKISLGTWDLAIIVILVNGLSAFWYAYNIDLLHKLPKIGPYMQRARLNAMAMLEERPWIRRWAVVGVGAFVVTPLPGSGALGGAVVGRIIGVSKFATSMAVTIAGVVVSVAYAFLAEELRQVADRLEELVPSWARITLAALAVLLMAWLMLKLMSWLVAHDPDASSAGGDDGTRVVAASTEATPEAE